MEIASDETLAQLVRDYRFLYDTRDFFYKDLTKKQDAWKDIGTRMNVSSTFAKNKWKSLREKYMRAKRMGKRTTVQRLYYLSFVDEFSRPRETCSNIPTQHSKPATEAGSSEAYFNTSSSSSADIEFASPSTSSQRSANTGSPTGSSTNVSATRSAPKPHPVEKLIEHFQQKEKPDELDLLFASYAETTKKMKPANQLKLKFALAQLVYEIQNEEAQENQEK